MNKNEIVSVLMELHKISGFRISLHSVNFEEIAAYPVTALPFCAFIHGDDEELCACRKADADACRRVVMGEGAYVYKCRYGLTEVICPLYCLGTLTGYLMMGQAAGESADRRLMKNQLLKCGASEEKAEELIGRTPSVSDELTASFTKIMTICAEYMTLTNAIPGLKPSTAELAKLFVYEHYHEKISISDICDALGKSKSAICPAFREKYGTTLTSYLNDLRIDEAAKLLLHSDLSVGEIADRVGYYDQSYFTKVFTKKMGLTPTQFKKRDI